MRITLVTLNSSYIHTNLALRYIADALTKHGHTVTLREFTTKDRQSEVLHSLYADAAEVYGFSAYIWNVGQLCNLASQLKLIRPSSRIVFGGPEVSYDTEAFLMGKPYIDHVICGEGESAFCELCGGRLSDRIINGSDRAGLYDFRDAGILYDRYPPQNGQFLYYESSRGCPYRCSYCMSALSGDGVRQKDADTTVRELLELGNIASREGMPHIVKLIDRTFNCDRERAYYIWNKLVESGVNCRYHFEIRCELLDDRAIEVLRRGSDIFLLEAGIQSANSDTLSEITRGGDPSRGLEMLGVLMSGKHPPVHADLIAGLPHEDYASFARSFDIAYPLCDELQLGFLKLLKGSVLRNNSTSYGIKHNPEPPYNILSSDCLDYEDIRRLTVIADLVDRYHNNGGFERTLGYLTSVVTPFALFEQIADTIPDVRRLSQREAYTALLECAENIDGVDRETLRTALCEDFTARERAVCRLN